MTALLAALAARDQHRVAAVLADDVRLAVPPLRFTLRGRSEVTRGLGTVLDAFAGLRYDVRNRYVAPGAVTDEVMLIGQQTGWFLGAGPSRKPMSVGARVILLHDEQEVTGLAIWPDLSALRAAAEGVHRRIDLTSGSSGSSADELVATLRASLPAPEVKVIRSASRRNASSVTRAPQTSATKVTHAPTGGPPPNRPAAKEAPKAPVPKRVRRTRAVAAAAGMAVASAGLVGWVINGALHAPASGAATPALSARPPVPSASSAKQPLIISPTPSSGAGSQASPTADPQLTRDETEVSLSSDFFFAKDSAQLTAHARTVLRHLITAAIQQHRTGKVQVNGYTDDTGPRPWNLTLSRRRAQSVSTVLRRGLASFGFRVSAAGYGPDRPAADNGTPQGQEQNRRVTVTFPPAPDPR